MGLDFEQPLPGSDNAVLRESTNGVLNRDAKGLREPEQGQNRHVVLGPFHSADIGSMDPSLKRQLFLR